MQGHFLRLMITAICVACLAHPVFSSRPREGCHRRRIIHTVRYANCQQRRMFSYACRGFCSSSVHVSRFVDNRVDSQCQCCRADQTVTRRMRLICPTVSGNRPFRILYIPVSIPRSCRCRPCSALPAEIIPSERNLLQHRQIYWRIMIRYQCHYNHFEGVNHFTWTLICLTHYSKLISLFLIIKYVQADTAVIPDSLMHLM